MIGAVGFFAHNWVSWLVLAVAIAFASAGLDFLIRLLPHSRTQDAIRTLVSIPAGIILLLVSIGHAVYGIVASIGVIFLIAFLVVAKISYWSFPATQAGPAHVYVALLITLTVSAYSQDRVLWPIKWLYFISRGRRDKIAQEGLELSAGLIRLLNFRRFAYQLAFVTYVVSVVMRLAKVKLSPEWESLTSIALESLLGFLAIDAYVGAFHPQWPKPRSSITYTFPKWNLPWRRLRKGAETTFKDVEGGEVSEDSRAGADKR
jgi:hypothetical protein